jgi:hypothetical protein
MHDIMGQMKTKNSNGPLDVRKIAAELKEYENSPRRGGLKINMPLPEALRAIAKVKPERNRPNRKPRS